MHLTLAHLSPPIGRAYVKPGTRPLSRASPLWCAQATGSTYGRTRKHENTHRGRPRTARAVSPFRAPESITCWTCGHEDYSAANGREEIARCPLEESTQ